MNAPSSVERLEALFLEAAAVNREALACLRGDGDLAGKVAALEGCFERKAALALALDQAQRALAPRNAAERGNTLVTRALQAQAEAARLESELAVALGNAVPRVGNRISAYQKSCFVKSQNRLDRSI